MPIRRITIENELIAIGECDKSDDFVAVGIILDENGIGYHSGILLCLSETLYFFHYTGRDVVIDIIDKDYEYWYSLYIKELSIVEPEKVEYFLGFCEILRDEVHPVYGWLFTNSFYSVDGSYYSDIENIPDITTCVGFCINVIRGFLYNNDQYITIEDWDDSSLNEYQEAFMKNVTAQLAKIEEINPERLNEITQQNFKRIMPSELTSSAFYKNLPITKINIDVINPIVIEVLEVKNLL